MLSSEALDALLNQPKNVRADFFEAMHRMTFAFARCSRVTQRAADALRELDRQENEGEEWKRG